MRPPVVVGRSDLGSGSSAEALDGADDAVDFLGGDTAVANGLADHPDDLRELARGGLDVVDAWDREDRVQQIGEPAQVEAAGQPAEQVAQEAFAGGGAEADFNGAVVAVVQVHVDAQERQVHRAQGEVQDGAGAGADVRARGRASAAQLLAERVGQEAGELVEHGVEQGGCSARQSA